jgi:cell division septal protein FtsQ
VKSETRSKILGLLLFTVLTGWILILSVTSERRELDEQINSISITGNHLLNENEYLAFAKLNKSELLKDVTLPVIKSRLEKHPYIKRANVEFSGNNEVHIDLIEKDIKAVIVSDNKLLLATDNFEILPLIPNTKISDMPVISNLNNDVLLQRNEILKTPGLVEAFKIMDAAELTNEELSKRLSEINMRNGGDIILLFSGIRPPVIFGKGYTAEKILEFYQLLKEEESNKQIVMNSSYIDLRFKNEIFLGNYDKTGLTE